jgi:hypothetical protein
METPRLRAAPALPEQSIPQPLQIPALPEPAHPEPPDKKEEETMKNQLKGSSKFILGLALVLSTLSIAQAADKNPLTPADNQAAMDQMQKYGTPGSGHRVFQQAVGRWSHTVRLWMKPGDKVQESQGTSENTLIFGGRFLKQEASGYMNGQPFQGLGYTGFDNLRGEYQSVWMDNMGTGMMVGSGTQDPISQTIRESGTFSCPMTGDKATWYRSEWKITDNNNQTYTLYGKGPDGKEFTSMEIVYKRMK